MNKQYKAFLAAFRETTDAVARTINEETLAPAGLHLTIDRRWSFADFDHDCVGVYLRSKKKIGLHKIVIALNEKNIFEHLRENDELNNIEAVKEAAWTTIGHEAGHGLVDFFENAAPESSAARKEFLRHTFMEDYDEEKDAEDFGARLWYGTGESILMDILLSYISEQDGNDLKVITGTPAKVIPQYIRDILTRAEWAIHSRHWREEYHDPTCTILIHKRTPYAHAESLRKECERFLRWCNRNTPGPLKAHMLACPDKTTHHDQWTAVQVYDPVLKLIEPLIQDKNNR